MLEYEHLDDLNSTTTSGKITKQDLVNWIITNFHNYQYKSQKESIQKTFFNEKEYLVKLLKNGKDFPQELKDMVRKIAQ